MWRSHIAQELTMSDPKLDDAKVTAVVAQPNGDYFEVTVRLLYRRDGSPGEEAAVRAHANSLAAFATAAPPLPDLPHARSATGWGSST